MKPSLRKTLLARRQTIKPHDHASWSQAAGKKLVQLIASLPVSAPLIIAGYCPIRAELNVMPALFMLAPHHTLALPVVEEGELELTFRRYKPAAQLVAGTYGIQEPGAQSDIVFPNVILVPLLAFDRVGHRLGYGRGYYDATLFALARTPSSPVAIGIGFALQEEAALPAEKHDMRLDWIVTEKEVIEIR